VNLKGQYSYEFSAYEKIHVFHQVLGQPPGHCERWTSEQRRRMGTGCDRNSTASHHRSSRCRPLSGQCRHGVHLRQAAVPGVRDRRPNPDRRPRSTSSPACTCLSPPHTLRKNHKQTAKPPGHSCWRARRASARGARSRAMAGTPGRRCTPISTGIQALAEKLPQSPSTSRKLRPDVLALTVFPKEIWRRIRCNNPASTARSADAQNSRLGRFSPD
jgi:hypothetical protein